MSILDITEKVFNDDSIEEYEYFEYLPISGTIDNLNTSGGDITISVESQDIFTHPSESYLLIEGRLTTTNNGAYVDADNITLTNNGLMYLFSYIRYDLSGREVERISHPGWATTMLELLKYDDDFSKSRGLNQLWYKDTTAAAENNNAGWNLRKSHIINDIVDPNPKGSFSFKVPLKHIFGFCEDYDKVLYGMKQTLYLIRTGDNDPIFKTRRADGPPVRQEVGKVTLNKIAWYIPHVTPTDQYKMELYKYIQNKETFPVNYRMIQCDSADVTQTRSFDWRLAVKTSPEFPGYIITGFQTDKLNSHSKIQPYLTTYKLRIFTLR